MIQIDLPYAQALAFLPFALPICAWVAASDLRHMRIPNLAVLALTGVFVVVGLGLVAFTAAMTLPDFLWRLAALAVVLAIGFVLSTLGLVGAGDAKFAAAIAPFVAPGDGALFLYLFAAVLIVSWIAHRVAGRVPAVRTATGDWASWDRGKLFPMGVALAGALVVYLTLGLILA